MNNAARKLAQICELLDIGMSPSGGPMFKLFRRDNNQILGEMSAASWLDHIVHSLEKGQRS